MIDYDKLLNLRIPDTEQSYTKRDTILYALGVGLGLDPVDENQLRFVYEKELKALPTMAVVLAHPGFWARDMETGIDWLKIVHGEQSLLLEKELPTEGTVIGKSRIVEVIDKGSGRGALVYYERKLFEKATGSHLATTTQVLFCRNDGGFGGPARQPPLPHIMPDRPPNIVCKTPTSTQGALLYRQAGDLNPLHADPAIAKAAGFPSPILHGLATFGAAGHAVLRSACCYRTEQIISMQARFVRPAYPGDMFYTEIWQDSDEISFQMRSAERKDLLIGNGRIGLARETEGTITTTG